MASSLRFCAVATMNKLAQARVLTDSILRFHPRARVDVLLVDPPPGYDARGESFHALRLDDLEIPGVRELAFKYTAQQFCGLLKAHAMRRLLARGAEKLVYLDATCLVLGRLDEVSDALDENEIAISPHLIRALPWDGRHKSDLDIVSSGVYNSGFVAVRGGRSSRAFLDWWMERTRDHCMPERGARSNDQKWIALVPSLFPGVGILRAPGLHRAYWNVAGTRFVRRRGSWFVDGVPCRFFQFSGYEPERPRTATRYLNERVDLARRRDLRPLFDEYRAALAARGYEVEKLRPYGFAHFDDGTPIPEPARALYREERGRGRFGDPFAANGPYFRWLTDASGGRLPVLWERLHRDNAVLRRRFPDPKGRHRKAYLAWAKAQGAEAFGFSPALAHY